MSCHQYRDSVVLLADGELTEDAASAVRSHVSACDACRDTLQTLQKLEALLTPETPENPTMAEARFWRSFDADLALRVNRAATPWWRRAIVIPVPAADAMSVAVVALGSMVIHERRQTERLSLKNDHLEASLRSVLDEGIIAISPKLVQSIAALEAERDQEQRSTVRMPLPRSTPAYRQTSEFVKNFRPAPPVKAHAKSPALPQPHETPDLAAGMEIRFVDSELAGADMY